MTVKKEWFESWFDSPYHALLYQHRDEHEAKMFIDNLFKFLKPEPTAAILDIACGDGRHAAFMKSYVDEVIGIDLSEKRIARAHLLETEKLTFYRQDMRNVFRSNYFDFAVNLFTSFGYFQHNRDNKIAAHSFAQSLKKGGKLVLDYMNVDFVKQNLVAVDHIIIDGIAFDITRQSIDGKIVKTIDFKDKEGSAKTYNEVVSEFRLTDFEKIFADTGLNIVQTFGDYDLSAFEEKSSPRLIIVFEKK